jgi:hypothetical protein
MTAKQCFLILGLTLLLLVRLNVFIYEASKHSIPGQIFGDIVMSSHAGEVMAITKSVIKLGFNTKNFTAASNETQAPVDAVNSGLGETDSVQHLVLKAGPPSDIKPNFTPSYMDVLASC